MSQQHPADIIWIKSEAPHLWTDFLLSLYPFPQSMAVIGMPPGKITRFCCLRGFTGIHHDQSFGVLDQKRENGQRVGPVSIQENVQNGVTGIAPLALRLFDCSSAGL